MLKIAGICFDIVPESAECPFSLADQYSPFVCSEPASGPISGRYVVTAPDSPRLSPIAGDSFWSNEIWRMGVTNSSEISIEICDVIQSRWVPVANLANDFSSGVIQPFYGRRAAPAPHALNYPYDQAILINRLLHKQVMVVHGAGIIVGGSGYVFFGPSGIGKTTISRLWVKRGAKLLNDDRVAVYNTGHEWRIAGTPWHGEEPVVSPLDAPLRGVVRLRQASENRVTELAAVAGISELLACALIPFFSRDGIDRAMDMLMTLPDRVPTVELAFRPEDRALDAFLAGIATL